MRNKRLLDIFLSLIGLIGMLPVMLVISGLIKLTSSGPVVYKQKRIGKNGKKFALIKFRTMAKNAENLLTSHITVQNDSRITPVGRFLRKWKLDELPSLWNVLKGDMSIVGPRPDVPGYADKLQGETRRILEMKPGITGLATLKYADEEKLLAEVENPKRYNDEVIFPDKVRLNLEYMDNWSLWGDVIIIFRTVFRRSW